MKIRGENILEMPENKRVRHISMMFQNCDLQFCMDTLREELRFCLENIAVPSAQMDERSLEAVLQTGMEPFLDRPLHSLSGGEKQKAALTCILALNSFLPYFRRTVCQSGPWLSRGNHRPFEKTPSGKGFDHSDH